MLGLWVCGKHGGSADAYKGGCPWCLKAERDDLKLQNGAIRETCAKIAEKEGCQGGTGCWTNEGHNDHSAICPVGIAQRIRKPNDPGMIPVGAPVSKGLSAPCAQCGCVHKPGKNMLCST